jgi:lysocardiolipin and lysophospholipid acyltransferase
MSWIFFTFAATVIEYWCQTKLIIHSNDERVITDKGILCISNHRTRVDWMFAGWSYASLLQDFPQMTFLLKEALKSVPFFGWSMQIMMYIFLGRNKEKDLPTIEKSLNYLTTVDSHPSLFIFPEGTDLSDSNKLKNDQCLLIIKYFLYISIL